MSGHHSSGEDPDAFFRVRFQRQMIDHLDLPSLVPLLSEEGLLTKHEQERLLNDLVRSDKRVMELVMMLSKKGSGCVRRFMDCLRKETSNQGHKILLCAMERSFNQTQAEYTETDNQTTPPAHSLRNSQTTVGGSESCSLHTNLGQDLSLRSSYHPVSHPYPQSRGYQLPLSGTQSILFLYQELISHLVHMLASRNLPQQHILNVTQQLLLVTEFLPTNQITDFKSLHSCLADNGMCSPIDIDFLIALLTVLEQHDLAGLVLDYTMKIMVKNVFTPDLQFNSSLISDQSFTLFTGFQHSTVRLGDIWDLKEAISNLLGIHRHHFRFAGSQLSPAVFVWQFPSVLSNKCTSVLCENQSQLISQLSVNSLPCSSIHYQFHNHRQTIFSFNSTETCYQHCPTPSTAHLPISPSAAATASEYYCGLGKRTHTERVVIHPPEKKRKELSPYTPEGHSQCCLKDAGFGSQYITHTFRPEGEVIIGYEATGNSHPVLPASDPSSFQPQYGSVPTLEDYRDLLMEHHPHIEQLLDLPSLIPQLNAHHLLTPGQAEHLSNEHFSHSQRVGKLLEYIRRKGVEGYRLFLQAIEEERTHIGHKELYVVLSKSKPSILPPRELLIQALKEVYMDDKWFKGKVTGPKLNPSVFINLALVKKKTAAANDKKTDKLLRDSLHGLVDDIERKKERIHVHDIFNYERKHVKRVLVEGAPGIGKTMLACYLCSEWAQGKILQEYDCVLFVPLRRFQGKVKAQGDLPEYQDEKGLRILDLVNLYLQGEAGFKASEELTRTSGDKTLLILEGWDELAPELRQNFSFFHRLITGDLLNKASILVTSRPTVSSQLYDDMDERRIEVLGFNKDQIREFVEKHVPEKKDLIMSHLRKFPNIQTLSHIPLTLSIICSVIKREGGLPDTLTGLYDQYVRNVLVQGLRKQPVPEFQALSGLGDLSQLPPAAKSIINSLCELALQGFEDKKFVFRANELREVGLTPFGNFDAYGLLSSIPCYAGAEYEVHYQFRHLTLQEFLAAKRIETFDHSRQMALLDQYRHDKQFQVIWKFLCGITKLEDEDLRKSIISRTRKANNRDVLLLLHCVYEAHDPDLCLAAAEHLNYSVQLSNNPLNATDCLCLSYTITQAGGEWKLYLRGCNMGAEGMEILKWHLANDRLPRGRPPVKIKSLDLVTNFLHLESDPPGVKVLAEIITGNVPVIEISVNSNAFGDAGAEILAKALIGNSTVTNMEMGTCEITATGAMHIANMLHTNSTIKVLFLRWNKFKDEGIRHIATAVMHNQSTSLEELSVGNNGVGRGGLLYLCEMLKVNKTLKILRIDASQLGSPECEMLTTVFPHNQTLELLECAIPRVYNSKSVQLPYGFYTRHLDRMRLGKVPLGDTGLSIIADGLKANPDCAIRRLGLLGCGITDDGVRKICELVRANLVETVHLGSNHDITDTGAMYLAKALEHGTSIKAVRLDNTGITEAGKKLLAEASKRSKSGVKVTYIPNIHLRRKLEEKTKNQSLNCGSSY